MFLKNILICLFVFITFSQSAFAYLDPGNGSMIVQIILASIFGLICTFKVWFGKIFGIRIKKKDNDDN